MPLLMLSMVMYNFVKREKEIVMMPEEAEAELVVTLEETEEAEAELVAMDIVHVHMC